jgi:hypothetical protein
LIHSTTGRQAALGEGNRLTDRSRESPLLARSNELHEQSEDEKAMNTAMKNQIDCSIEFVTYSDPNQVNQSIE